MFEIENFLAFRVTSDIPPVFTGGYSYKRRHLQLLTLSSQNNVLLPMAACHVPNLYRSRPDLFNGAVWSDPRPLSLPMHTLRAAAYGFEFYPAFIGYIADRAGAQLHNDVLQAALLGKHE